ncbi:N-acylglucosamine-6-phosphate 2-epimerase [Saliniradius amylolyticus]|uniref:Putative N-acetylmannosamine-6-phosphate 2-epimerase n=1 Tax=Saliniradius amylolyticus TaxID=2183582 RepID=A0A2S2E2W3_9ALTE|nr:putative N-acetylmannosamine-6-phosphate 2-epimerase [Saliniradius amylolyticus]AWL11981.1 N-acylglucosamine-6-phosphate 2-epimerase [Saliniradius amylolyticus]
MQVRDEKLSGGLIVSCQPVDNGPMDNDDVVKRLAQAAIAGGADGVRIENARRVAQVREAMPEALIIGIVKRDLDDSPVRITPYLEDVAALATAGADVIAVDATDRDRPVPVKDLIEAIKQQGKWAMADCSCLSDALSAMSYGADIVGSTLSGYTGGPPPTEPDYKLLEQLVSHCPKVMAEGRFNTPQDCAKARSLGAWAVTVGTAITRTEVVTGWFADALNTDWPSR